MTLEIKNCLIDQLEPNKDDDDDDDVCFIFCFVLVSLIMNQMMTMRLR